MLTPSRTRRSPPRFRGRDGSSAAVAARGGRGAVRRRAPLVPPPEQAPRGEGLGEEEVGARVASAVLRGAVRHGGEHDDRGAGRGRLCAQAPAGLDPVEPRHVVVEEDDLRLRLGGGLERLHAVAGLQQRPRHVLQRGGDELSDEWVVVDDEDDLAHAMASLMRANASSGMPAYAATIAGSNCVPEWRSISCRASFQSTAVRYGRSVVSASSVSATANTRAASGISSPRRPSG